MNDSLFKSSAAAALLMTWGALAYLGKTSVEGFITALNSALIGLGVYHVASQPRADAASDSSGAMDQPSSANANPNPNPTHAA